MNTNQRTFSRTVLSVCIAALLSPAIQAAEVEKKLNKPKKALNVLQSLAQIFLKVAQTFLHLHLLLK